MPGFRSFDTCPEDIRLVLKFSEMIFNPQLSVYLIWQIVAKLYNILLKYT